MIWPKPTRIRARPTTRASHGITSTRTRNPRAKRKPAVANTARKPAETMTATVPAPLERAEVSPRKNPRYAGSIANPHGFTVDTIPAAKATASKPVIWALRPSTGQEREAAGEEVEGELLGTIGPQQLPIGQARPGEGRVVPERIASLGSQPRSHVQIRLRMLVVTRRGAIAGPPPEPFRSHLEGLIEVLRPELQLGHVVIEATGLPGAFEHRPGELLPRPESTGHRGIDIQRDVGPDRRKGVMKPVEPLLAIRNLEEVARFPQCRHRGTSDVVSPLADDPVVLHPDLLTEPEDGRAKAGAGGTEAEATCLLISLGGDGEEGYLMQALPSLGESTREGLEGCRRQGRGRGGGHDSPHSVVLHNQRCPLQPAAIVVWPTVCPDLTPGEGRRSRKVEATRAAANRPSPTLRGSSRSS